MLGIQPGTSHLFLSYCTREVVKTTLQKYETQPSGFLKLVKWSDSIYSTVIGGHKLIIPVPAITSCGPAYLLHLKKSAHCIFCGLFTLGNTRSKIMHATLGRAVLYIALKTFILKKKYLQ